MSYDTSMTRTSNFGN